MWLSPLVRSLPSRSSQTGIGPRRRPAGCQRWSRTRLVLETLEDRLVPSFAAPVAYGVGTNPRTVAVGDFNNDGKLDLVAGNGNSGSVSVLLNNGDGTFQSAINTNIPNLSTPDPFKGGPPPLPKVRSLVVGDFNLDGNLDLAVTSTYTEIGPFNSQLTKGQLTMLLGNGTGSFPTNIFYTSDSAIPDGVAVGDLDGDSNLDVVVTFGNFNAVSVLPGQGDGTLDLAREFDYDVASGPIAVVIGDVNSDSQLDVVTANISSNNVSVLLGNGDATLQAPVPYAVGTNPTAVALGDVDGDGQLDMVTANRGSNDVSILLRNGDGSFQGAVAYAAGTNPTAVALGDFNQDGKPDLAVTNGGGVTVLLGVGAGTFQTGSTYGTAAAAVAVGNFNGDGFPDLAVANAGANTVAVLLNTTDWVTPSASITGPSAGASNQVLTFTLGAGGTGLPADTVFSYAIDWDSDGSVDETVNGVSSTTVTHAYATNGFYTITLTATDPDGHTSAPVTQTVTVLFVASITGPPLGARNQSLTYTLSATVAGLPASTVFSYAIDWDGNGSVDQIVSGVSGTTVMHSFAGSGSYATTMTATINGQTSAPVSQVTTILPVSVTIGVDPRNASKEALLIDGSSNAGETIVLSPGAGNGIAVSINGTSLGTITPTAGAGPFGLIIVHVGSGANNVVRLTGGLNVQALIFGGNGGNTLDASGSTAANVLVGGTGADALTGGSTNDVLIGGGGGDTINGSGGDDIVIDGTTRYDSDQAALLAILAEWSRTDATYATRVSHLKAAPKGKNGSGGLNGSIFLNTSTVFSDAATDVLLGGSGMDWYFAKLPGKRVTNADTLSDRATGETVTSL